MKYDNIIKRFVPRSLEQDLQCFERGLVQRILDTGQNTMSQFQLELINRPERPETEAFTSQLVPVSHSLTRSRCMCISSSSCSIFHHCISSASANWSSSIEFGFSSLPKIRKNNLFKIPYEYLCINLHGTRCYNVTRLVTPSIFCFHHTHK